MKEKLEDNQISRNKKIIKEIGGWIICIVIAVILALLIKYFILTPTVVKQESMYPTLEENQRLILNRLGRTFKQMPKRGDIITFEAPTVTYRTEEDTDISNPVAIYEDEERNIFENFSYNVLEIGKTSYIKRVIGLPGDHVQIKNGKVYINEEELEEDYLQPGIITDDAEGMFYDIIVPENTVFAMGDNRNSSVDCRAFGCIPLERIEGKVLIRFWPLNEFGKVEE
jgi:signal peptidase I